MSAPQNGYQTQGLGSVNADQLNTFVQWCPSVAVLRTFIGLTNMTVYLLGLSTPGDGGQGNFYWNSSSTGPDDGVNTILPSGSTQGAWIREAILTNQAVFLTGGTTVAVAGTRYIATAAATLQLPQAAVQSKAVQISAFAYGGAITLSLANAGDNINGGTNGASAVIPAGFASTINTDGILTWYVSQSEAELGVGTIASAATTDIGSKPQPILTVSGSASITSFGTSMQPGQWKKLIFTSTPTLVASGTMNLPSGASIGVLAGSIAEVWCSAAGTYYVFFQSSSGGAVTQTVGQPQGRLTPTSSTPVINADATAQTTIYYTPYIGQVLAIYNGASFIPFIFAELSLALASQHVGNSLYDVFGFSNAGAAAVGTGPAWAVAGNYVSAGTLTPGTAARGTGAGTTELQRINGIWTNKNAITLRNGATTYSVAANQATYLGTIWTDATAGQVTCQVTWGQNRKFGVWNAYNREAIVMLVGDSSSAAAYNTATLRAARGATGNSLTVLTGLAEEWVEAAYQIELLITGNGTIAQAQTGIGYGSLTASSGVSGYLGENASTTAVAGAPLARYAAPPVLGLSSFTALEAGSGFATNTWQYGSNATMELRARYNG